MKPYIICHMVASLDGRINSGHWSRSPDRRPQGLERAAIRASILRYEDGTNQSSSSL
jgi:riboflavin biosynthesis pyrimidine reductase